MFSVVLRRGRGLCVQGISVLSCLKDVRGRASVVHTAFLGCHVILSWNLYVWGVGYGFFGLGLYGHLHSVQRYVYVLNCRANRNLEIMEVYSIIVVPGPLASHYQLRCLGYRKARKVARNFQVPVLLRHEGTSARRHSFKL